MINETNTTAIINNMPIKPETFLIVIGVCFVISLVIGIGFLLWAKMK